MDLLRSNKVGVTALAVVSSVAIAACGSSSKKTTTASTSSNGGGAAATVSIGAGQFTNDFTAMAQLKPVASAGKGKVVAILPDTTSSTRYVEFDQPDLIKAAEAAGLSSSDIKVQNAGGSDPTFLTDAESAITNGASVLLIDPEDSGTGLRVQQYAAQHGVKVIDYDRLTVGGTGAYYVSFNNVRVGQLIGDGFVSCASAWGVKNPKVIMMRGDPTDNNASLFYQGYSSVLAPYFKSGQYKLVASTAGTWTPATAQTEFEQALTAHPNANSAVIPNDENGAPIITYLKGHGIKPHTFPTTGQDATLTGLQNVLTGYQCGTVYKAVYKEAQAAIALAIYLRAGQTPPSALVNGSTTDPQTKREVPSVLLAPVWVTTANMKNTIVADKFVPTNQLCAGAAASECKKLGITG